MKKKLYIYIILGLCFLFGLLSIKNVGVYNDEHSEQEILMMNVREYAELMHFNPLVKYFDQKEIIPISSSIERDHGISSYYLFSPFMLLGAKSPKILSIAWHIYTYLIFFSGVIVLYFLCKELFENNNFALLASCMYFLTPRIFADGLYNNKDIVLLTLFLHCLYFGIRFIKNKNIKNAIIFGIFGALATNTRIVGIFIFGLCGLFYLIDFIKDSIKNKKINTKELLYGFIAIISMIIVYTVITPSIWGAGKLDLIGHLNWSLRESTKFSRWNGTVLFEGVLYNYENGDILPLHYLPKLILITTPIYILVTFIIGFILLAYRIITKKENKSKYFILVLLSALIPFIISLVTHTKLYNGWRHFYFLYDVVIVLSIYAIKTLYNNKKLRNVVFILVGVSLAYNAAIVAKYGVNNTAYYNHLVSHKNIETKYELDYYGVTTRQLLSNAIKNRKNDVIYVYYDQPNFGVHILNFNYNILSNKEKEHIALIFDKNEYDKLVSLNEEVYKFYNNTYVEDTDTSKLNIVYSENCMKDIASALYK